MAKPKKSKESSENDITLQQTIENSLLNGNDRKEIKSKSKKTAILPRKIFFTIPEHGWCTPWAETLDFVNIYFLELNDKPEENLLKDYAKKLGSGITENINDATHIIIEPTISNEIIKEIVFFIKFEIIS